MKKRFAALDATVIILSAACIALCVALALVQPDESVGDDFEELELTVNQGIHGFLFVGAVGDQIDGAALNDPQREDPEQALGIDSLVVLLHPNGALKLVCLLNKKGGRSGVEANLVVNRCLLNIHK